MSATPIPEGHYADVGEGRRVHFHEAAAEAGPGEGRAVIFIHGSGPGASGLSNFRGNYREFAAAGFRAIIPDSLGYGLSSKPEGDGFDCVYLADGVRRLADALGLERFSLVGNSLGGAMAMQIALDFPDRVDKLVLMAPGGLEARERYMEMKGIRAMMRSIYGPDGITEAGLRKVFELQLFDHQQLPEEEFSGIIAERFAVAQTQPRRVFETLRVGDYASRLGELRCPVFGLWGRDDAFCPVSGAQTLLDGCADVRVVTLANCGHWVMVERRELFNRWCLDFLTGAAA